MHFLFALAALLLTVVSAQLNVESTITVHSTTLITITSCHPTATDCPGRDRPGLSSSIVNLRPNPLISSPPKSSSTSSCHNQRCNADNCLRAFERGQGQDFCSTFTKSVITDTAGLPSYTAMCAGSTVSRVSSACSCLNNACIDTSSSAAQLVSYSCNADNCLRAFERGDGLAFCSTFTRTIDTRTDSLPLYATECTGSTIDRVSSACSCLSRKAFSAQSFTFNPQSWLENYSQVPHSTSGNVNTHTSQPAFSTPASVNTHTSQQAFSTPASSKTQSSQTLLTSSAAAGSQQTASASASAASSGKSSSSVPAQVFSFTSVWTNSAGSVVTSIIQETLAPSTASPGKSTESSVSLPSQQSSQSLQVFSFTTTGINSSGSFSSVIVATLTPSQSSPQSVPSIAPSQFDPSSAAVFSFISTGTNAQGSPFTTVIVATVAPSSSGAASVTPSLQPFSFTSTGTNAQGSPFTTVIQGTLTPSGAELPFTSSETLTNAQGSKVTSVQTGFGFPFTSTLIGTNNGLSFTSLVTGIQPGGSFTGLPSPTGHSTTSGIPLSIPLPTTTPAEPCSPFPTCLYPAATDIPATCSPFPGCLLGAIPTSVRSELSWNCGTTSLLQCILGEPDATCNQWPQCLSTAIVTDICDGFPFPDCLFTLYSPIVTSTITTDPPGLTSISTSIPGLTSNTVTKTQDSNGVAVWWPVFAGFGCPECGGTDWILGNLPMGFSFPFNVEFTLPGFPEIPEFQIPCIFFCSTSSPHYEPLPPMNDPNPNRDQEPTSTKPSSSSKSSSSSACTATVTDCSTLLQISISGTVSTTTTSISCAPVITQCSQKGSSTTTSTTTSASSTPTWYMITPDPSKDISVLDAFTNRLKAETDPSTLWIVDVPTVNLISFWAQFLSPDQVQVYSKDPAVIKITNNAIEIDESNNVDFSLPVTTNDTAFDDTQPAGAGRRDKLELELQQRAGTPPIQQYNPQRFELNVISQPKGVEMDKILSYAFQDEIVGHVMVYIIDSGCDSSLPDPESAIQGFPVNWLYPGNANDANAPSEPYLYVNAQSPDARSDATPIAHGTCMLAKAVSAQWGVSKNAAVTIVRLPAAIMTVPEQQANLKIAVRYRTIVDAFRLVLADVISKGLSHRAVINFSMGTADNLGGLPQAGDREWELYQLMQDLIDQGVVIVTSSGNRGAFIPGVPNQPFGPNNLPSNPTAKVMTGVPAVWNGALPIVVVGGADNLGTPFDFTQFQPNPAYPGNHVDVWAPAGEQWCPSFNGQLIVRGIQTSGASAMTAGLIAYFLGTVSHTANIVSIYNAGPQDGRHWSEAVKQYITTLSYVRDWPVTMQNNPANVIYNGEIPLGLNQQPVCPAATNKKRQGDSPSCPISPASASALSASAASASVASASLASVASVASVSSASAASVSAVSVSSAEARSSRLATATAPQPTATGYLGDNCNSNQALILDTGAANTTIKEFCTGFWSWLGPRIPPSNVPGGEGVTSLSGGNITYKATPPSSPNMEISTELIVGPYDGPGACAVGGYPRSIGIAECIAGFSTVFDWCLDGGGAIVWLTSDAQGCMIFEIDQSGAGLQPVSAPSATSAAPGPSTVAPPPPPAPTAGVISHACNDQGGSVGYIELTSDVSPAILSFCPDTASFMTNNGPSENKIVGPTGNQEQLNLALSADGTFPAGCVSSPTGATSLASADCISVLSAAAQCIYGGTAIFQTAAGVCVQGIVNMENLN